MKICLACSIGGHLTQMFRLMPAFEGHDTYFVTFEGETSKDLEHVYFIKDWKRNPLMFFVNFFQSLDILLKEKPDVIVSTGAGIAIPTCYLGKLFGKKIIFIESFSRIKRRSATGKTIYPIADLFLVQWKSLLKEYGDKAKYKGAVF